MSSPSTTAIAALPTASATSTAASARIGSRRRHTTRLAAAAPTPSPSMKTSTTTIAESVSLPPRKIFSARCQTTWLTIPAIPESTRPPSIAVQTRGVGERIGAALSSMTVRTMKIHHLNCGTMCPATAPLIEGSGSWLSRGKMVCHCLLVESPAGLVLVEAGMGTDDLRDPARMGRLMLAAARPRLDPAEPACRQIEALGHTPSDVRHVVLTHLDVDHAGGIADFPDAAIHVSHDEHAAAQQPDLRYIPAQWAHGPRWTLHRPDGDRWFGFDAVTAVPGTDDGILLVPLPGHSVGHCGVAVRGQSGWWLHAGDAFFHRRQLQGLAPPLGLALFERFVNHDVAVRRRNQERLVALARDHGDEVRIVCAHDPVQFEDALRDP